jgi:cytoskeletal protein CcmA (bactofilin family)
MTSIGPQLVIDGEVSSDEDLTIAGTVHGRVTVRGASLVIERTADVHADLRAERVVVHGAVQGAISAAERIELSASSSVEGSLSADSIVIAEGARFSGHLDMGRRTIAAKVAEYRAGQPSADL